MIFLEKFQGISSEMIKVSYKSLAKTTHKSNIEKSKVFLNNSNNQFKNITGDWKKERSYSQQQQNLEIKK